MVAVGPIDSIDECRALLGNGSRSFAAAARLLPAGVRDSAIALYAFCRLADDAIDLAPPERHATALAWLHERLDRAYAGRPMAIPADRAMADVVARHGIPRALPAALLEGFAWDAAGRRYGDLAALEAYAVRVAGTVGTMMAVIMGVREPAALARACDLGVAMQYSNIARDVGEDARCGRLYLPADWLAEAGVDAEAWLARPYFSPAIGAVVARLLAEADRLYARADQGIAALPLSCRPGIRAARLLYAEIGHQVARAGFDSVSRRAVVSGRRKVWVLARRLAVPVGRGDAHPSLDSARFLMEAVAATPWDAPAGPAGSRLAPLRYADERAGWVIDLFARLEERATR